MEHKDHRPGSHHCLAAGCIFSLNADRLPRGRRGRCRRRRRCRRRCRRCRRVVKENGWGGTGRGGRKIKHVGRWTPWWRSGARSSCPRVSGGTSARPRGLDAAALRSAQLLRRHALRDGGGGTGRPADVRAKDAREPAGREEGKKKRRRCEERGGSRDKSRTLSAWSSGSSTSFTVPCCTWYDCRGRPHLGPQGSVRPGCPAGAAGPVTVTMTLATWRWRCYCLALQGFWHTNQARWRVTKEGEQFFCKICPNRHRSWMVARSERMNKCSSKPQF